jgi:protein ImuB
MLWLALHLPWLPLEALQPEGPEPQATQTSSAAAGPPQGGARAPSGGEEPQATGGKHFAPRCVIEQRQVQVASRAARALGVEAGMSASSASSLAPQVQQLLRDERREAEFVRALALAQSRYTPNVVLLRDGVLLEVSASLRLFGGLRSLMNQVRATTRDCAAHARVGLAPTAAAAALFARFAQRACMKPRMRRLLDALPLPPVLEALQQPPRLAELLQAIGCCHLGEVRALPRAGLTKRGAIELLVLLDRAYGDAPDPRAWFEPPERFAMSLELMHRADDAAQLVFAAQRLVQPLVGWLSSQWLAASRLRLKLRHERGRHGAPDGELLLELGSPSRDAAQIMTLLRERLQRHQLAAPVYAIELQLDEAVSSAGTAGQLLPDPGQQAQEFQALLDRLASRLGIDRVQRLALAEDHRPERASVAVTPCRRVGFSPPSGNDDAPQTRGLKPTLPVRPLWLLPQPMRLAEREGRPVHGSLLTLLNRAERIEAGWFDGALVCRDYHVAEGADQRLRWIYRERHGDEIAWYLHGLFA